MTRIAIVIAAALAFVGTLPAVPAHAAARDRVFVASYGVDSGACTFGSPCKTFAYAVANVAVNGEVTAIDSAGFGSVTITQSVTITSPAGVEAGIQALPNGDAISIVAPGANVTLRGLTLEGAGVAYNGIDFTAGASLTVIDCVVQNFISDGASDYNTGNGILMQPTSGAFSFVITNTILSNNGWNGIYYLPQGPTATGVIDHVVATNNGNDGIRIDTGGGEMTTVAISNSIASNNLRGIELANYAPQLIVSIDNTGVSGNPNTGISAPNSSKVLLGRSAITGNGLGIYNGTSLFYSYKDNRINGNTADVGGPSGTPLTDGLQ